MRQAVSRHNAQLGHDTARARQLGTRQGRCRAARARNKRRRRWARGECSRRVVGAGDYARCADERRARTGRADWRAGHAAGKRAGKRWAQVAAGARSARGGCGRRGAGGGSAAGGAQAWGARQAGAGGRAG